MNECRFQPLISAYYDEELDVEQAAEISDHLKDCPNCTEELRLSRLMSSQIHTATGQAGNHAGNVESGSGDLSELMHRIHAAIDRQADAPILEKRNYDLLRTSRFLMAMAASVLIVCGVWLAELKDVSGTNRTGGSVARDNPAMVNLVSKDWEHLVLNPTSVPPLRSSDSILNPRYARTIKIMRDGLQRGFAMAEPVAP